MAAENNKILQELKKQYPKKFEALDKVFETIHPGDRIFIATGCGEPQYLVRSLIEYVENHPKAFCDTEILHVWTLGVAPYTSEKFKYNFRHNSFFIGNNTREAVNTGRADYTPVFLADVPELFRRGQVPIDVAFIQTSLPDRYGYFSLGINVDIVKAAIESAATVIAQVNSFMPRVHGDSFIHVEEVDYIVPFDEPLLEFNPNPYSEEVARKIGSYVARIIEDGDTIQVGYGGIPNAILSSLYQKKHLGVHTELFTDGIVELMKRGVVDNSLKEINRGKTVAAFCMGRRETYEYLNDNPAIDFKPVDYTNNVLVIARHRRMAAINSALEVDLTGQATAESLGKTFYSGVGGQADFMRGASLSPGGKTILTLPSTTLDGKRSRIVPVLQEGAGVTLTRADVKFVVTEYGIAYLHGKNIRERAMSLIAIAHPQFRPWLIEEAKKMALIYKDQAFIAGEKGEYPEHLETYRTTRHNVDLFIRPVKISDEPLLKDFFYALSDKSMYQRFFSIRRYITHEELQKRFVVIDYTREVVILAIKTYLGHEVITGMGQYCIDPGSLSAECSVVVRDDFQNKGIGSELLSYLAYVAKKQGLLTFTAEILPDNAAVFRLLDRLYPNYEKKLSGGTCSIRVAL